MNYSVFQKFKVNISIISSLITKLFNPYKLLCFKFGLILILFLLFSTGYAFKINAEEPDWTSIKNESKTYLEDNKGDIEVYLKLAISQANSGEITDSYETFDILREDFTEKEVKHFKQKYKKEVNNNFENNIILPLNFIAFSFVIIDEYEPAIKYFYKILEKQPENIWIRNYLAAGYIDLEKFDKAEEFLEKTLEIENNQFSHLLLGYIYYERGNTLKALGKLARSRSLFRLLLNFFD